MGDNGERIYAGLMEREDMQKLEEENKPPAERAFRCESDKYKLAALVNEICGISSMGEGEKNIRGGSSLRC